jgi:hypothetical protein
MLTISYWFLLYSKQIKKRKRYSHFSAPPPHYVGALKLNFFLFWIRIKETHKVNILNGKINAPFIFPTIIIIHIELNWICFFFSRTFESFVLHIKLGKTKNHFRNFSIFNIVSATALASSNINPLDFSPSWTMESIHTLEEEEEEEEEGKKPNY